MNSLIGSADRSDVNETGYTTGTMTVTTSATEAKVGASRLVSRQILSIFNSGSKTVYYGPTGVTISTGVPIFSKQVVDIPIGDVGVFLVTDSGTQSVVIQEFA